MGSDSKRITRGLIALTALLLMATGLGLYRIGDFSAFTSWLELSAILAAMAVALRLSYVARRHGRLLTRLTRDSLEQPDEGEDETHQLYQDWEARTQEQRHWDQAVEHLLKVCNTRTVERKDPGMLEEVARRAEAGIHSSEELQTAFHQSSAPLMVATARGVIVRTNPAMKILLDRHFPRELSQRSLKDLWPQGPHILQTMNLLDAATPWRVIRWGASAFEVKASAIAYENNEVRFLIEWSDPNPRLAWHRETARVLEQLREGALNVRGGVEELDPIHRLMMEELNHVIDAIVLPLEALRDHLKRAAQGDLNAYVINTREGNQPTMTHAYHRILNSFNEVLSRVRVASSKISGEARKVTILSQGLAQITDRQKSALEQVESAMKDLEAQADRTLEEVKRIQEAGAHGADMLKRAEKKLEALQFGVSDSDRDLGGIIGELEGLLYQIQLIAKAAASPDMSDPAAFGKTLAELSVRGERSLKKITERAQHAHVRLGEVTDLGRNLSSLMKDTLEDNASMVRETSVIALAAEKQLKDICVTSADLAQLRPLKRQVRMKTSESQAVAEKLHEQALKLQETTDRFQVGDEEESPELPAENGSDTEFGRY